MKIMVVSQYYYPEQFKITDICEELAKRGHDVTVLTGLPNYPEGTILPEYRKGKKRRQVINGVKVIRASLFGRGKGKAQLMMNYLSFAFFAGIKALFLPKDFDVVYVFQLSPVSMAIPAIILKKRSKKPLKLYCLDLWPQSLVAGGMKTDSRAYGFFLRLSRWIYRQVDHLSVNSDMFKLYFRDVIRYKKNIAYMPMYAEAMFDRIVDAGVKDGRFHLLFAGNIGEMQDVETIIRAAKRLSGHSDICWHIVGSGSKEESLLKMAQGMENVIFHGRFPLSEMAGFYGLASAFLITLKDDEVISYTLPNKVQSYMAVGKPIFGAVNGEVHRTVQKAGCGAVVRAGDDEGLAEAVLRYYQDTKAIESFSQKGKSYYQNNFSFEKYFSHLEHWLAE